MEKTPFGESMVYSLRLQTLVIALSFRWTIHIATSILSAPSPRRPLPFIDRLHASTQDPLKVLSNCIYFCEHTFYRIHGLFWWGRKMNSLFMVPQCYLSLTNCISLGCFVSALGIFSVYLRPLWNSKQDHVTKEICTVLQQAMSFLQQNQGQ